MHRILDLLEKHSNISIQEISTMLDMPQDDVAAAIEQFKKEGVIVGNRTIVNWQKTPRGKEIVTAFIELKVTPQFGKGFDQIAERIYQYEEVKTVYLMSGAYDLAIIVEGKSLTEVSLFVSEKLSPMETVLSTATHFVLKKYKEDGLLFENPSSDERQVMSF